MPLEDNNFLSAKNVVNVVYKVRDFFISPGFRLSLSEIPFLGRADIYHKGVWTPVCNEDWNISIARMACRERGFSDVIETFRSREQDSTSSALVLDTKECSGEESSIISCASYSQGADECRPLWVICKGWYNLETIDYRNVVSK